MTNMCTRTSPCRYIHQRKICCLLIHHQKNMKKTWSRIPFPSKQKELMVEKLNVRKLTLNKVHPYSAVEQMRMCWKFSRDEFLSGHQISSFFSGLFSADYENMKLPYMKKATTTFKHLQLNIFCLICIVPLVISMFD